MTEKGRTFLFAESGSAGAELAVLDRGKLVGKTGKTVTFYMLLGRLAEVVACSVVTLRGVVLSVGS